MSILWELVIEEVSLQVVFLISLVFFFLNRQKKYFEADTVYEIAQSEAFGWRSNDLLLHFGWLGVGGWLNSLILHQFHIYYKLL